jgi:hypothetical protein
MSKKHLVFKKNLVAHALTLAFGVAVITVGVSPTAMAQSSATATIFGNVKAGTATSVVLKNLETGLTRTVAIDATGKFQATSLPNGRYSADLMSGTTKVRSVELEALAGQGTEAVFVETAVATAGVQSVQVSARRTRIDVSNATNGATFTAKELAKLPITPSLASIIQLAPNTTRADSRYAGGASFGGGGASENAYYINGFPVTNPLTQLGSSELPFGAISQAQVLTGGFGAEFGRSVGGVVNITTKSGTNNWEMGATASISPSSLRANPKDLYYGNTGVNPLTDGKLYRRAEDNTLQNVKYGAYLGGPIIKDKLFMFVAAETSKTDENRVDEIRTSTSNGTKGWETSTGKVNRYAAKIDFNITDDHRLEFTALGDKPKSDQNFSGYDYATRSHNGPVLSGAHYENVDNETSIGGDVKMLKYTGNLTNNLTLTALYGASKVKHTESFDGADLTKYQVIAPPATRAPGFVYNNPNPVAGNLLAPGAEDQVKSMRLDLEYRLGKHTIRAGLDDNKLKSLNAGDSTSGGGSWTYFRTATPNTPITLQNVSKAVASGGGLGTEGYYVRETIFNDATTAYSDQSAQYIEDKYQATKDVILTFGLRNEQFTNKNGDEVAFLEMKNQIAPRFNAVWDVNGDASLKAFGSLGRYHVQIPTHLAVRGASRSTFTRQSFTYTGVDSNGAPTGLVALNQPYSTNNEYGQAKLAATVSALDMKPTYQDEITLGFEKAFSPSLNFGAKGTYRKLQSTIDDLCDQRGFNDWLAQHPAVDASNWGGFGCASFNPGEANDFLVDFAGTGTNLTQVHLTKEMLGMPKAERNYFALDLFAEHPFRNGWYGKLNYTWSRSKGNTEGQTLSDVAQTDVAATQTWDTREIMEYKNGLLPNDRTHQIKAYGFYEINPMFTVGANFLAASGRPKNCIGNHPTVDPSYDYGSAYAYCNGVPSPRGTTGNLPWDIRLDLNLVYSVAQVKGLALKLDVFNVTNRQTTQTIDEVYNSGDGVSSTYSRTISYTAPRSARLTAEYNYKF